MLSVSLDNEMLSVTFPLHMFFIIIILLSTVCERKTICESYHEVMFARLNFWSDFLIRELTHDRLGVSTVNVTVREKVALT